MLREKGQGSNMARIITQLYEHTTRALLEAALATRELGYTDESGNESLSFKTNAGAFRRFPSLTLLARSSAAALIGYNPATSGMAATTLQAAIDELKAAGTGGTTTGSGTAGVFALWSSGTALGNGVLSQSSNQVLFEGDTVANLYRAAAGSLQTDGSLGVVGGFVALGLAGLNGRVNLCTGYQFDSSTVSNTSAAYLSPTITKNNSNVRVFNVLYIAPSLIPGGSNASTTLNVLNVDPQEVSNTGLTVNLLRLGYNGAQRLLLTSAGNLTVQGSLATTAGSITSGASLFASLTLSIGTALTYDSAAASTDSAYVNFVVTKNNTNARTFSGLKVYPTLSVGGSNTNTTVNLLETDTVNGGVTGLTVNLLKLGYGGIERFRVDSVGNLWTSLLSTNQLVFVGSGADAGKLMSTTLYTRADGTGLGVNIAPADADVSIDIPSSIYLRPRLGTPADPAAGYARQYMKGTKIIWQYNDTGTVRYRYMELSGAGAALTDNGTTPP